MEIPRHIDIYKHFNNERRNTMNKFWAKVRFERSKNAEHLVRAFFQNFNAASSIVIRGNEAKMEIAFRQPPMEIIQAINFCQIIELNYGKNLKEYEEDETIQLETENSSEEQNLEQTVETVAENEDSEQTEQVATEIENCERTVETVAENEDSEQIEQVVTESKTSEQPKNNGDEPTAIKITPMEEAKSRNIPDLERIAKQVTSFEEFAKLVAEWLEMDKRKEFFENLVIVSAEVDKITWKELEKALKSKHVFYSQWDRVWSGQQVSKKLKEYSVTILTFLKAVRQYKEYSFKFEKENSIDNVIPKLRVKMQCMPEIKEFEETLASVDKTQPVKERVRYVLEAMGLNEKSVGEQNQFVEVATTAVRKKRIDVDTVFLEANIPIEQVMMVRMTFSQFVNDFAQKYERDKKVKLLTFLLELQKIIMLENEMNGFSDVID